MNSSTVKRYLPWVVATTMFMEQLDSTILNTAVPSMARSLHVTPLSLKSVVAGSLASSLRRQAGLAKCGNKKCNAALWQFLFQKQWTWWWSVAATRP